MKNIKFVCPECEHTRLECCMDGPHTCPVTEINAEGDHEYGEYESSAIVDRWQCEMCGFTLMDNKYPISDNVEVVKWCLDNCPQE